MNKQDAPPATDETPTGVLAQTSAIRRFFNAIRRWEEIMEYTPNDFTNDRVELLEGRVLELERALKATVETPPQSS